MAIKTARKPVRREAPVSRPAQRQAPQQETSYERPQARREESEFVNVTKLFPTKNNPDNLVGSCRNTEKNQALDNLEALVAEAKEKDLGVTFFAFLNGQYGPSLAATLARPEQDRGSFNDGNRGRPQQSYSRRRY